MTRPIRLALDALGGSDFLESGLSKEFRHGAIGSDSVRRLSSWADINEALLSTRLEPPRMRLFHAGAQVDSAAYMVPRVNRRGVSYGEIAYDKVETFLRDGASMAVDAIDEIVPSIRDAAHELEYNLRERVQANAYVTWGEISGFGPHWDDHDTVIVQVEGRKHWRVFGPGRERPMFKDFELDHERPETVVWEGILNPGDVIHVPRGWWHEVTGMGEGTYHLTFGFTRQTALDAVNWLVEQMRADPEIRRDVEQFDSDARGEQTRAIAARLRQAADDLSLEGFLDSHRATLPPRFGLSLPWAVDPESLVKTPATRVVLLARVPLGLNVTDESVVFEATGKKYRFHASMGSILLRLERDRVASVEELSRESGFSPEDFDAAISVLVANRVVALD